MRFNSPTHKLIAYYASLAAVGLIVGVLGPSLGDWAHQTHSTLAGVSIVLAMRPLGYLGGAVFCGHWLSRHRGHPTLALAALACAALLALLPLAKNLDLLAGLIFALGFAHSLLDVGSNTLIPWVYGDKVGPYLSGMHFSFGVGAFLAPLLAGWALTRNGSTAAAFWILALLLMPLALWLSLVPSPSHEAETGSNKAPLDRSLAALFMACFFLYGGVESGFGSWIYQYSLSLGLADVHEAAFLTSLFWGLLGLGRLFGIPVLARFEAPQFLAVIIPGALVSLALLLWRSTSVHTLWLCTAGMGLSMACIFPTLLVYAGGRLSHGGRVSSRVTSLLFVGSSAGTMTLPWIMGQVFVPDGPRPALAIPLASLAGLLGVFFFTRKSGAPGLSSKTRRQRRPRKTPRQRQ